MPSTTCANCGEELEPGWDTCPACTSAVSTIDQCGSCKRELKPNWKICPYCKTPTQDAGKAAGSFHAHSPGPDIHMTTTFGSEDAKMTQQQPELAAGTELLHYRIDALLGRGGLSRVYRAYHMQLQERLALKVVASLDKQHPLLQAYKEEYRAQRSIPDKSHILHCEAPLVHRHASELNLLMLPMELARESLRDWMARHPAENEARLERGIGLFLQACRGVAAMHGKGLVHLDLKPENILLTGDAENPVVKVADFGIARSMSQAGQRSELYADGIGTPAYMAPEQILAARWKDVGKEADIYALGMILYELLDGDLPYSGSAKAIKEKKRDTSLSISPLKDDSSYARWAMQALDRNPSRRPELFTEALPVNHEQHLPDEQNNTTSSTSDDLIAAVGWLDKLIDKIDQEAVDKLSEIEQQTEKLKKQIHE